MSGATRTDVLSPQDVSWAKAASADERLATGQPVTARSDQAGRRLAWWTEMAAFQGSATDLDDKLAPVGVTAANLTQLLGESTEDLRARLVDPPAWFTWFTSAWQGDTAATLPGDLGLLEAARPLLATAQQKLRTALADLALPAAGLARLADILCAQLPLDALGTAMGPTMVLELNVARVEGRLAGDTPLERLAHFGYTLRDNDTALAIWQEYPVLARYVVDLLDAWVRTRTVFARRLVADLTALRAGIWGDRDPGELTEIQFGAGDTHRGGQSVAIIRFGTAGVVYKPRSLAVDEAFQGVVEWFNAHSPRHALRCPLSLRRNSYGWAELVAPAPCGADDDLAAFYWRTGAQLALLYALRATDFHSENLIAAGPHPILVDLEALLHPTELYRRMIDLPTDSGDPAEQALWDSVLHTGLLPTKTIVTDPDTGEPFTVDISGVGGDEGQRSLVPVPVLEGHGTDAMRLVDRHVTMPGADNRPQHSDGSLAGIGAYRDDLIAGFEFGYQLISRHREDFLGPDGLLAAFGSAPVRIVPRATYLFARVLQDSLHPDFLRDGLDRLRCLARLCEGWNDVPARERMIAAEMRALAHGDIPLFEARPTERDLWLDDGSRVDGVLERAPLDWVRERIAAMGPRDLELQRQVIVGCYAAAETETDVTPAPGPVIVPGASPVSGDRLIGAAERIATRLDELAVRSDGRIGWLSATLADERLWLLAPTGIGLYSGLSGIGLFLCQAARLSGSDRLARFAHEVTDEILHRVRFAFQSTPDRSEVLTEERQVGAFGAILGPAYFLASASRLLDRPDCLDAVVELLLPAARAAVDDDVHLDLVNGAAGCVLGMVRIHQARPDSDALAIARQAADHLLAHRVESDGRCGWPIAGLGERPQVGLSHGASGFAVALARLHAVAPDPRYPAVITGALRYEADHIDERTGDWLDLRGDRADNVTTTWCYGAPGIGLARLDLLRHPFLAAEHDVFRADLARAVRVTGNAGLLTAPVTGIGNHCLCHGDFGNLELLLAARCTDPDLLHRVVAGMLDTVDRHGWRSGLPSGAETPGLMLGLSGIGYQLLRIAAPDSVPSVLMLDPPAGQRP